MIEIWPFQADFTITGSGFRGFAVARCISKLVRIRSARSFVSNAAPGSATRGLTSGKIGAGDAGTLTFDTAVGQSNQLIMSRLSKLPTPANTRNRHR